MDFSEQFPNRLRLRFGSASSKLPVHVWAQDTKTLSRATPTRGVVVGEANQGRPFPGEGNYHRPEDHYLRDGENLRGLPEKLVQTPWAGVTLKCWGDQRSRIGGAIGGPDLRLTIGAPGGKAGKAQRLRDRCGFFAAVSRVGPPTDTRGWMARRSRE